MHHASTHPLRHWESKRENQRLLPEDVRGERQEKARKELERREWERRERIKEDGKHRGGLSQCARAQAGT